MNKIYLNTTLIFTFLIFISCEELNEGINDNPNDIVISDIEATLFLTGGQLANTQVQLGRLSNVSSMYSGQLIGFASIFANQYGFNISTGDSDGTWRAIYVGVITNMRHIINSSDNALLVGIAQVVEAHAISTGATIFGDIPYKEIGNLDITDPVFDSQIDVFNDVLLLLDDAIVTLQSSSSQNIPQDIYFEGDKNKWIEAAYTLKARIYLQLKDYSSALSAAQNGISSASGDLEFIPRGAAESTEGDKNLTWVMLEGSRAGDLGNIGSNGEASFLMSLLDPSNTSSRNHAKTNETSRHGYFQILENWSGNNGIVGQFERQNMISFFENKLIMAECAARNGSVSDGLSHLNDVRSWMSTGGHLNSNYPTSALSYISFSESDFNPGGIENPDSVTPKVAFLREVIEERYVSGFTSYMPFNDARRLRKDDQNISVPFVMVGGPNPPYPERLPYSADELNSNSNAPEDPGIFVKTKVNE